MQHKHTYIAVISIILLLSIFGAPLTLATHNCTIDGDAVFINDSNVYLSAMPHTIYGEGWVYSNLITKSYTGTIDVAYGFNTSFSYPTAAQLYDPHTVHYNTSHRVWFYNVSSLVNTPTAVIDYGNPYNPYRYTITYQKCTNYDDSTQCTTWTSATAVVAFDSYTTDDTNYTAYYHTERTKIEDYRDISGCFNSMDYDYDGKNKWYYVTDIPTITGQQYTVRTYIVVNEEGSDDKYDIAIKPSFETLSEAITAGHFYILDPWAEVSDLIFTDPTPTNETTIHDTNHTTINVSIVTSDLSYFAFNWNGINKTYTTCGTQWNESTNSYIRTTTVGTYNQTDFDNIFPWSEMHRCTVWDNGTVNYYLNATDSTLKADGTASDLTGADGQVMVEIPKFYYSYTFAGSTHHFNISRFNLTGFKVHNAFIKDGAEVDYRYIGAYEGSMYDVSAGAMVPSANITDNMYASGDKLCSVSGEFPKTNEMRSEFRTMAVERGSGWRQLDFDLNSAVQLLYIIEYGDFDSQASIGYGRTQLSGGSWDADSYIGQCGKSNADGDGTNSVAGNTNNAYMTYRGIENWYGNIWKWNDGININNNVPYVTNNASVWADDTETGYTNLSITLAAANNWQITLADTDRGFLPASVGTSSAYICDYYWQNTGWRVVRLGGLADGGGYAGAFCMYAYSTASYGAVLIGGRLAR